MSLFGACWTAGSLKYLAESGVKGVTYFETTGVRGIYQGDFSSPWPDNFQSISGMLFPVYYVFRYLLKNKKLRLIKSISSHPLKAESLVLSDGTSMKLILANFTQTPIESQY